MSFGNENVFNEKKMEMGWGQSVYYSYSRVYSPADYQNENQFVAAIKDEFVAFFDQVYQQYTEKKAL
jgi:hypothetical protein